MKTKALVKFLNRVVHYSADVELVDVFAVSAEADSNFVFKGVSPEKHPILAGRQNSDGARQQAIRHLKSQVVGGLVKDLYEDVTLYLTDVIECVARHGFDSDRLVGEHSFKLEVNDLLKLGSWAGVTSLVSQKLIRALEEERSTMKLIQKLSSKLGLRLESSCIEAALPYLEARHLLVHRDGIVDAHFELLAKRAGLEVAAVGSKLSLDYRFARAAGRSVQALVEAIDASLVSQTLVGLNDQQA